MYNFSKKLPAKQVGIGLRHCHFAEIIETKPATGWLEVHTENFFSSGGIATKYLEKIRESYALSAHSVGLSLGSGDGVSKKHLTGIKNFITRFEPFLISDHLSWGAYGGTYLNDLLPIPYTEEALKIICTNIAETQEFLGRKILVENPSAYIQFAASQIPEHEFMAEIARKTGCGILLDINNIYVTAHNHGLNALEYIEKIPAEMVGEIHLAGYAEVDISGKKMLLDDHGNNVYPEVWKLFASAAAKISAPTLIEWDSNIPALSVLLEEAEKAEKIIESVGRKNAA